MFAAIWLKPFEKTTKTNRKNNIRRECEGRGGATRGGRQGGGEAEDAKTEEEEPELLVSKVIFGWTSEQ